MESLPDLPPRVPEELPELDRALQLLRAVCAGKLKDKLRIELEGLVGGPVTQQLAAHWKTHLGEIRRDLAEELKRDPAAEVLPEETPVVVEPLPTCRPVCRKSCPSWIGRWSCSTPCARLASSRTSPGSSWRAWWAAG